MKVMTVVSTRPDIIKLSLVIQELDHCFNHVLVNTMQNYDENLNKIFFKDLGLRDPNYTLPQSVYTNLISRTTHIMNLVDDILQKEQPDAVLYYGDCNGSLSAYAAKRRKIPVFHMEAGNRCFDDRVPEEVNRRIIDHIADVNMVISEQARRNLIAEGFPQDRIIKVGSCMREVLHDINDKVEDSTVLKDLNLDTDGYFLVSVHREENVESKEKLSEIVNALWILGDKYKKVVVFSTHPRTKQRIEEFGLTPVHNILFHTPFNFSDYVCLEKNAFCVLSDSGSIMEEASILQFPAVMLREAHERQEGVDEGTLIMASLKIGSILQAVELTEKGRYVFPKMVEDYDVWNVPMKVVNVIASYTDYVNRVVWKKY